MLPSSRTNQPRRLRLGGLIDRSRPYLFRFNGQSYQGYAGDTLASALLANDVVLVARSCTLHRPRGIITAGADEPNAYVTCNGRRVLATTTPLFDGLTADSLNHWPSLGFDLLAATPYLPASLSAGLGRLMPGGHGCIRAATSDRGFAFCDVLVVGGGPAGLMAALAASRSNARVILVDDDTRLGGRLTADRHTIDRMPAADWVAAITAELAARPQVRIMSRCTVVQQPSAKPAMHTVVECLAEPPTAASDQPSQRQWSITAKQCIVAPGYVERPLVFANNDRPGIMLAGGLRSYLNRYAVSPGERVVLYATHDEAAMTIADITRAGAIVEAVIDPRHTPSDVLATAAGRVGADVVAGSVSRALGSRRVEGVEVRTRNGTTRTFDCDLVAMSDGWSPALPLQSADTGVLRVTPKTASLVDCLTAGLAAGLAAAAKVGFPDALVDVPETDEDGSMSGDAPWPHLSPLRGLASGGRAHGVGFADFATDGIAQAVSAHAEPGPGAELVTFAAVQRPHRPQLPPPAPPFHRLVVGDVFGVVGGTTKRFGRSAGPASVTATRRRNIAIARLIALPNQKAALATRIADRIGLTLPPPGRWVSTGHLSFAATQPTGTSSEWLAIADDETAGDDLCKVDDAAMFAQQLVDDLGSFADVIDLTPDIVVVDVTGPGSCDVLALGLELDTAPLVFPAGHCTEAALGRMMITVSCVEAGRTFQLAIRSSDLPEFANWLAMSGTVVGLEVIP